MKYKTIALQQDTRGVVTLFLNQPETHNALSPLMISELSNAAEKLAADDSVRVVVLTGEGKSFCAGGDLGWMRQQFEATRETRIEEAMKLARMLRAMNELPKPLIGKIQGQAFGGGIGMMSVCDVAIGNSAAKFALTETRLGLIPATISPYVLARMGEGKARRVFMSGKVFNGEEAVSLDLLASAVSADMLDEAVEAEIKPYLATAPGAVARAKAYARSLGPVIDEAQSLRSAQALADAWDSPEAKEGVGAFFDKRKPDWNIV
jgi:methylglutaconyl-CoA hydratase